MHILEIPSFFPPYGGEFCIEQSRALQRLGHEVRILSVQQLSWQRGLRHNLLMPFGRFDEIRMGIPVYRNYMRAIPRWAKVNAKRWQSLVLSMYKDYERRYGRPDILHAHCCHWAGCASFQIHLTTGLPYIITEHLSAMLFQQGFEGRTFSQLWEIPLIKQAYQQAAMVIPVSRELVDDLSGLFGNDYRWKEISNVIDTDFFRYKKRNDDKVRHFCCVANYEHRKGYDLLLQSFGKLLQVYPDVTLTIAGRDTDDGRLQALADGLPVTILGEIDRKMVRTLLYDSDCLVLATRSEAQGLVLLEAMSTGIPVVTTTCIPQSVRRLSGCHAVDINDADVLAQAMATVVMQKRPNGKAFSQEVASLASPMVVGKKLEKVFSDAIFSSR